MVCSYKSLTFKKVLYAQRYVAFFKFIVRLTNMKKRHEHQETNTILIKKGYIVKSVVTSNRYLDKFITHHEIDYKYLNYFLPYLTRTCIINTVSMPLTICISIGEVDELLLNTLILIHRTLIFCVFILSVIHSTEAY